MGAMDLAAAFVSSGLAVAIFKAWSDRRSAKFMGRRISAEDVIRRSSAITAVLHSVRKKCGARRVTLSHTSNGDALRAGSVIRLSVAAESKEVGLAPKWGCVVDRPVDMQHHATLRRVVDHEFVIVAVKDLEPGAYADALVADSVAMVIKARVASPPNLVRFLSVYLESEKDVGPELRNTIREAASAISEIVEAK